MAKLVDCQQNDAESKVGTGRMAKRAKSGGRKKGTPNKTTAVARDRIEAEGDPIGFLLGVMNGETMIVADQKDGDAPVKVLPTLDQRLSAATTLARKTVPDAKDKAISVDMPEINTAEHAVQAVGSILAAVTSGEITPTEGQVLAGIVENFRKAIELHDLDKRVAVLEEEKAA